MRKKYLIIGAALLPLLSIASCTGGNDLFDDYNGRNADYYHSVDMVSSPYKNVKSDNYSSIYSESIELTTAPQIRQLPSNYCFDNEIFQNKILYHGQYHGYDVFSWDDDNAFGFRMHGFQIDGFKFSSSNYIILVCFEHTDEPTCFYDDNSTNVYLSKKAIPLTYLYTQGIFALDDIKTIYLERAYWLSDYTYLNGHYVFQLDTSNRRRINQGDYPFDIHLEEYSYSISDKFHKAINMDQVIQSPNNAIYFGTYNGWELFMSTNGDGANYSVNFNNTFNLKNSYLSNIYGFSDDKVENVSDLYQKGIIGDNHLERITNQCLSYCVDSYLLDNGLDISYVDDYLDILENDLYEEYLGYDQESIKYYLVDSD